MKLLVINGPNLNMLGKREKSVYGEKSYKELLAYIKGTSKEFKVKTCVKQYNGEGEIVTAIQKALGKGRRNRHQSGSIYAYEHSYSRRTQVPFRSRCGSPFIRHQQP